ncbi:MAG TPA: rhomboid family intramembrane serine protease [Ktedonobacterales bacterium]|nr:rhomboid family intramembrane serine protease [Ktedonobacterales bacterium]
MIPISDDPGPRRRFPFVNYALILINVVVFVLELNYGDCFIADYSTVPAAIVHDVPATIQGCPIGQPSFVYLTLLTSMFLHANLLHIGGNMLYLFIFGDNVEDRLGHFWYLVFYLFCGLVASLAQIAVDPTSTQLNLGASGAIAGVLGAYLVFYPGAQVRTLIFLGFFVTFARLSAIIVIGLWFVLQLVSGLASLNPGSVSSGGVAYFAHVGGFAAGFVIALLLRPFLKPVNRYPTSYPAWPQHADLRNRTYGGKYDG